MSLPEANLAIKDGGLGVAADSSTGTQAFVGTCSSGTANTEYQFTDSQTMKDTLGTGPLVEQAANVLAAAGGVVLCVKAPSSTAGAAGSVTPTKTGTATLGVTGGALDSYDVKVVAVQGGATLAAGTATFKYSLDGGRSYSSEIAVPTSGVYAIPETGLTLTWTYSTGTAFVAADQWVFTTSSPTFTLLEMGAALDVVLNSNTKVFQVHVVGAPTTPADAAALAAALDTKMSSAETSKFRYLNGLCECPEDTDANVKSAFASFSTTRVSVGAGYCYLTSSVKTGVQYKRNIAWAASARASAVPPHEDLGKVKTGPLKFVQSLVRDEFKTPGLDQARFITARTHIGRPGAFITNPRVMSGPTSDYKYLQHRRVMDIASAAVRDAQLEYLNDSVRVNKDTGLILEEDARSMEAFIERKLRDAVTAPGHASDVQVLVDRTTNIISTSELKVTYRVIPLAYAKFISGTISFFNPALAPV